MDFSSVFGSIQSTVETKIGDVEGSVESGMDDELSGIGQDVPSSCSDVVGGIEGMLEGNATSGDGTSIPKNAMMDIACIIFGDFAATLVACAIVTNLSIFGEQFLHYDSDEIEKTNLIITGVEAGFYLLTGCFTDWFGGYSEALKIYGRICFIGTCILPLLTFNWSVIGPTYGISVSIRRIFFYTARIVAALGVCGIQVTSPPYAARQVEPYGSQSVQSCFHYIYLAIQCAPLLALTGISFVQTTVSFFCGYLSTVGFIILTMVFFKFVKFEKTRQSTPDKGESIKSIITCAMNEMKSKLLSCASYCPCSCCTSLSSSDASGDEESALLLCDCLPDATLTNNNNMITSNAVPKQSATTSYGSVSDSPSSSNSSTNATSNGSRPTQPTIPSSKSSTAPDTSGDASKGVSATNSSATSPTCSGSSELAEAIKSCSESERHCLWVGYAMLLLSCQIPYSLVHYQLSTTYVDQAMRMKASILGQHISPTLLGDLLPLIVIIITLLVNVYVYPFIETRFKTLTAANRIALGIVLATLSVLCAAIAETARKLFIDRGDSFVQEIDNQSIVASDLTLGALIPQYVLMGAADVFVFITSLEFAFRQSPCTMQAIATGIFLFYEAIGRLLAMLLVPLINTITAADPWLPSEINDGHLNYYFLVLTAISLTNLIVYLLVEKGYEEVDQYLCPDEETYGGGSTTSCSTNPATKTADTPTSPTEVQKISSQAVTALTSSV
ncbi:uncharacterized protein LOC121427567 [Lytechinus variegatus]|uniref:uncharacterized protein LOC121427567 n=1 Tax=Lytechinus variegatus TaxID=7654 RepID=UPI001BB21060|nr:uncharacterized protein LOC121427567 [Lytechinus variegatus]